MKLKNVVLTASSVALLSACADLGFGDFPLADATGEIAGPVMVADLETTAVTEAAPMPEKGPVVTTMPPEITVADLGPVPVPRHLSRRCSNRPPPRRRNRRWCCRAPARADPHNLVRAR